MSRKRHDKHAEPSASPSLPSTQPLDAVEALLLRARKLRQRGDARKALVTLRHACNLDEGRARSWAMLGAFALGLGQRAEAARAFEQARWLNARAGFDKRAALCEQLAIGAARDAA